MEIKGFIEKKGKFWIIKIPCLDLFTQGKSRKDAFEMVADAILELIESYFGKEKRNELKITARIRKNKNEFGIYTNNYKILFSLVLIRQRELSHSTVSDAERRLRSKISMSYVSFESGTARFEIEECESLLHAANPETECALTLQ